MGFLDSIFSKGTKDIIDSAGNVINKFVTSDSDKLSAKTELSTIILSALNKLQELQASIILAEIGGNWLQRSWRPITMLTFTALIVLGAFIPIPYLNDNSPFWDLLYIGFGGYIMGRSVEKVVDKFSSNIDISMLKKKDRKDQYN